MSVTTTGNTIFADRDPTASDDLAHTGVDRGVWWVNTSSGAIFVLSAEHPQ